MLVEGSWSSKKSDDIFGLIILMKLFTRRRDFRLELERKERMKSFFLVLEFDFR